MKRYRWASLFAASLLAGLALGVGSMGPHKPPAGAVLDRTSPLGRNLAACVPLISPGVVVEVVSGATFSVPAGDVVLGWAQMPCGTVGAPWTGPCTVHTDAAGPDLVLSVASNPAFQVEPDPNVGISFAYLFRPDVGIASRQPRRIGDTDETSNLTLYESPRGHPGEMLYTYRDAANAVHIDAWPCAVRQWHLVVVCERNGSLDVWDNGKREYHSTNIDFHRSWWQGQSKRPTRWYLTEGTAFGSGNYFAGEIGGAWYWYGRCLTDAEVADFSANPWSMFVPYGGRGAAMRSRSGAGGRR